MVDYVDMTETYMAAGDFDSRKRYLKQRTGVTGSLAIVSGVTWTIGNFGDNEGQPFVLWKWSQASRGSLTFSFGANIPADPTPLRVTDCTI
jgi:hypothetical protein